MTFKAGNRVTIEYNGGRAVDGQVTMASENGRSLMLEFEALIAGYAGMMPVLEGDDGVFRDLILGQPVVIKSNAP